MIIDLKKHKKISATFFFDHIRWMGPSFLILVIICYLFLDRSLATYLHEAPVAIQSFFTSLEKLFSPLGWILLSSAAFFYVRFIMRKEKKSRRLWLVSLSLPLTFLLCKVVQFILGRSSPEWLFLHGETLFRPLDGSPLFSSLPSLTAASIAALANSLATSNASKRPYFLIGGFLLSLLPTLSVSCFLSDSLMGFYLGSIGSTWIYTQMRKETSL